MNREISISGIAELNRSNFKKDEFPPIIYYLDTGSLTRNKFSSLQRIEIGTDKKPSRAQRRVQKNTILYSTVRPNQEHFGIIEEDKDDLVVSTGFTTIDVFDDEIDSRFLYYLLTQPHITDYLHTIGMSSVSSYPSISPDDLGSLEFSFPRLKEQLKISKVLHDIDRKIEINDQINTELEATAKLLYDYWFVQFDFPDQNGDPYKSSGGKMVYNEELKREIPQGWIQGELQDIANITMGQSPPGDSYNEEGIGSVFYQGCTDFGTRFPSNRKFTTEPSRFAKKGDILLSVRAPVGTMNIANEDCCIGRGLAALNSKDNSISYLDGVMQYMKQIFDRRNASGTTFGSITKGDLFSIKVVIPDKKVLKCFDEIAKPMFEKQNIIGKENQKLAELRDWLLPMLMNGQVKVN